MAKNNFVVEVTFKDLFHASSEILKQYSSLFMRSLDVESLIKNIPLGETIGICVNSLFQDIETHLKVLIKT